VGRNRGSKQELRGKLTWTKSKANRGRKPAKGKRLHMPTWAEVRATIRRNATVIVPPPVEEREAVKAALKQEREAEELAAKKNA